VGRGVQVSMCGRLFSLSTPPITFSCVKNIYLDFLAGFKREVAKRTCSLWYVSLSVDVLNSETP
jgi:hypothetical protein